jgi:heme-degrading monooxygenase HmoA
MDGQTEVEMKWKTLTPEQIIDWNASSEFQNAQKENEDDR